MNNEQKSISYGVPHRSENRYDCDVNLFEAEYKFSSFRAYYFK